MSTMALERRRDSSSHGGDYVTFVLARNDGVLDFTGIPSGA
jgi:hypothetical protein